MTTQKLPKVFIVGESGTTGLRLHDRLISRSDIELLSLPDEKRKDIHSGIYCDSDDRDYYL